MPSFAHPGARGAEPRWYKTCSAKTCSAKPVPQKPFRRARSAEPVPQNSFCKELLRITRSAGPVLQRLVPQNPLRGD
eukprot:12083671-Alexandrium_andersonii.AAC.1